LGDDQVEDGRDRKSALGVISSTDAAADAAEYGGTANVQGLFISETKNLQSGESFISTTPFQRIINLFKRTIHATSYLCPSPLSSAEAQRIWETSAGAGGASES
jgi:hypothetical protein